MNILFKILAYSFVIVSLGSCRGDEPKRMPDTIPDIKGSIISLTETGTTQKNSRLQLIMEAEKGNTATYPQASVKVDENTLIEDSNGKRLKAGQLKQGQQVEIWFDGAVLESMPVQATAIAIRASTQPGKL